MHSLVFMIGGCPRVGKSTLAQLLVEKNHIPYGSLDVIVHMFKSQFPDLLTSNPNMIPERFYPYLEQLVRNSLYTMPYYTFEGVSFDPIHTHQLSKNYNVRSCFLGASEITFEQITSSTSHNNWTTTKTQDHLRTLPEEYKVRSNFLEEECNTYKIPYFDMSKGNYKSKLQQAHRALTKGLIISP
jgi:hypothetical protein